MKGLIKMLSAVMVVGMAMALSPMATAQADSRPCVTQKEWRKVTNSHLTKKRVHRVFDTKGKRVRIEGDRFFKSEVRRYPRCNGKFVKVHYVKYPGYAWQSYWG